MTIGVIGVGLMGAGIVEVCARAGNSVVAVELSPDAARAGRERVESSTERALARGNLTDDDRQAALGRIAFTADLEELAGCEWVIEAMTEDVTLKLDVFARLDKIVESETAVLASNTSSIPIARLGRATGRPESVVGLHFFSPVPVMPLVEIVRSLRTSDEVVGRCKALVSENLGKEWIVAADRSGFVVNVVLVPYLFSAMRLVESGFATAADVDKGMRLGAGHPAGPLAVADFVGLDTLVRVGEVLYAEFLDPAYSPPPMLRRLVDAGWCGRKSGRGFYEYSGA